MRRPGLLFLASLLLAAKAPPVAVHINQIGFLPGTAKRAILTDPSARPLPWQVIDATGKVVAEGQTSVFGDDAASGDHVHRIELAALTAPGTYRLQTGGVTSHPFTVAATLYAPLAKAALNFFYHQRAGVPIEARYVGGTQWARAAGHSREVVTCFAGRDERGTDWPGCAYTLDVTGGWYDAGDHGKYVVNGGIALWTLQNLFETSTAAPPFADGTAALPEAGNGLDDLLDEARREMGFLLSMQVPDGQRLPLPVGRQPAGGPLRLTMVDAGGMAHHKVADRHWTGIPTIPAEDREDRLLYPPGTAATLNLVATASQAARIWKATDPAFARRCLEAAARGYRAALRNPEVYAAQAFTGSGGYGDDDLSDEFYWATAELYATTRMPELATALHAMAAHGAPLVDAPGWGSTAALGTTTLATAAGLPPAERDVARAKLIALADRFLADEGQSGYHIPYATRDYPWGSNASILNRAMVLGLAANFTGRAQYRDAVVDAADYVLGRNPLDQSYVSGFGWKPMQNPHHRFWAHQFSAKLPGPPPGAVSGGPNNTAFADPVAKKLEGRCAAQRCWRDDADAYALNEVAINWNAPLVWIAAWLNGEGKRQDRSP